MNAIGIVGGVGPSAGIDLAKKVFAHTRATKDQDHIPLYLTSCPSLIPDRTAYLLEGGADPVPGIQACMEKLALCGATALGVACNTAHSPRILGRVRVPEGAKVVNMIDATCKLVERRYPSSRIGIIASLGTQRTGVYDDYFRAYPDLMLDKGTPEIQEQVHRAIYDPSFGIKATPEVTEKATKLVQDAVDFLKDRGCAAVILGCTELPLVFPGQQSFHGTPLLDPTDILATELIKATEPDKLI